MSFINCRNALAVLIFSVLVAGGASAQNPELKQRQLIFKAAEPAQPFHHPELMFGEGVGLDQYLIEIVKRSTKEKPGESGSSPGGAPANDKARVSVDRLTIVAPVLGIDLEELPAVTKAQVKELNDRGIILKRFVDDPGGHFVNGEWPVPFTVRIDGSSKTALEPEEMRKLIEAERLKPAKEAKEQLQQKFHYRDVLLTVDGKPITGVEQFLSLLLQAGRQKEVAIEVLRDGRIEVVKVVTEDLFLPSRRQAIFASLAGVFDDRVVIGIVPRAVDDVTRDLVKALRDDQGVLVESVLPGGAAEQAGIKPHDIILTIGGQSVRDPDVLTRVIQENKDKQIELTFLRSGGVQSVTLAPQSTRQFELVDVRISKQSEPGPGVPWSVHVSGAQPGISVWDVPFFVRDGQLHRRIVPKANLPQEQDFQTFNVQVDDAPAESEIQAEIREIRDAVESLNRTIEKLEKRLNEKATAEKPTASDKQPGSDEQPKSGEKKDPDTAPK